MVEATRRSLTVAGYRYDAGSDSVVYARRRGPQTDQDEPPRHRHSTGGAPAQRRVRTGGGAFSADDYPPTGDRDDDPPDRNEKRHREIDERRRKGTLINSEYLQTSKFVARRITRCEVEKFEKGKDILIGHWILQMETYFMTSQIPVKRILGIMVQKIAPKHFDEIRPYLQFDYLEFREKLFEVFGEPDTIHAKLQELSRVIQFRVESFADYMHRVRMLVIRAHHDVPCSE